MTTTTHDAYRLTPEDEQRSTARMAELAEALCGPRDEATDRAALERAGAHAIGCSLYDLRPVELAWLADRAAELAGHTYRLTWTPLLRDAAGHRWDGTPEEVARGAWPKVSAAWTELMHYRRAWPTDPTQYRTIPGASSANGRRYALHIIGAGTAEIWHVEEEANR